jgi:hypothetical protein
MRGRVGRGVGASTRRGQRGKNDGRGMGGRKEERKRVSMEYILYRGQRGDLGEKVAAVRGIFVKIQ